MHSSAAHPFFTLEIAGELSSVHGQPVAVRARIRILLLAGGQIFVYHGDDLHKAFTHM